MVVICKNWQALPVSETTVTIPIIEDHARPPPDTIQQPTAHLSSKPDIVELQEINHDEPNVGLYPSPLSNLPHPHHLLPFPFV